MRRPGWAPALRRRGPGVTCRRLQSTVDGCGSHRCTSRCAASASSTWRCAVGQRGRPEHRQASGQVDASTGRPPAAPRPRPGALRAPARRRPRARCATGAAASAGRRAAALPRRPRRDPPPTPAASPAAARRRRRTAAPPAARAGTGGCAGRRPTRPRRGSGSPCRSQSAPRCASIVASTCHASRSRLHGSSSPSRPSVPARTSPTSRRGEGNRTFAQMPSGAVPAPSRCDSRWATHRSTPRVGTATMSGVNGSAGVAGEHVREGVDEDVRALGDVDAQAGARRRRSVRAHTGTLATARADRPRGCGRPVHPQIRQRESSSASPCPPPPHRATAARPCPRRASSIAA